MPRVHYFVPMSDVRGQAKRMSETGLHAGIDICASDPLFGAGWDKEARELGALLRGHGLRSVIRGPGWDLPLGAIDPYVVDQVRVCHERALGAAMHLECDSYLVRLPSSYGLSRSRRLSEMEAASRMLEHLSAVAQARGVRLLVQHQLEASLDVLELALDHLEGQNGGFVFSPARACWARFEGIASFLDRYSSLLVGVDLTDLHPRDLEPMLPRRGILAEASWVVDVLKREEIQFCGVHLPDVPMEDVVESLNEIARAPARARSVQTT